MQERERDRRITFFGACVDQGVCMERENENTHQHKLCSNFCRMK